MKKVLRWKDKHSDYYWDISTPEQELSAYLKMFELVDEFYGYFPINGNKESEEHIKEERAEIESLRELKKLFIAKKIHPTLEDFAEQRIALLRDRERDLEEVLFQKKAYTKAKQGDGKAAKLIIDSRYDCEYEKTFTEDVSDPLTED